MQKTINKISKLLGHPWMPAVATIIAILISLPSLRSGFCLDDNYFRLILKGETAVSARGASPLNLFCFYSGDSDDGHRLKNIGILPWSSPDTVKHYFFRPLSALSYCFDYMLWPDNPLLMHAQSILWLAILVFVVSVLYRKILVPGWIPGLAILLFAVDYGHGFTVSLLSNRNSLISCVFGVLCLICYDRWKQIAWHKGAVLAPIFFFLSLLSAEAGIAIMGFLFSYALFIESGSLRRRITNLIPYGCILIVWKITYTLLGYGADITGGFYVDPTQHPLVFLKAIAIRAPIYLTAQFALPPLLFFPISPLVVLIMGIVLTALLLFVFFPLVRQDRVLRFWAVGTLLAVLPICAVSPQDRNFVFVSVGAAALMTQAFSCFLSLKLQSRLWRRAAWFLYGTFFLIHGLLSPFIYLMTTSNKLQSSISQASAKLPSGAACKDKTFVIVNTPHSWLYINCVIWLRALQQQNNPFISLFMGKSPLAVTRVDEYTIKIKMLISLNPFIYNRYRLYMIDYNNFLHVGDKIHLDKMSVEVLEMYEDIPICTLFHFKAPLEDPQFLWFYWEDNGYAPFTLPAIGETITLKPTTILVPF